MSHWSTRRGYPLDTARLTLWTDMCKAESNPGAMRAGVVPKLTPRDSLGHVIWETPRPHNEFRGSGAPPVPRSPRKPVLAPVQPGTPRQPGATVDDASASVAREAPFLFGDYSSVLAHKQADGGARKVGADGGRADTDNVDASPRSISRLHYTPKTNAFVEFAAAFRMPTNHGKQSDTAKPFREVRRQSHARGAAC